MIIDAFSVSWIVLAVLSVATIIWIWKYGKNKTANERKKLMQNIAIIGLVIMIVYKAWCILDPTQDFTLWTEFPLQPCNICCIFILIGMFTNCRLLAFSFFVGLIAPVMALVMPSEGFYNVPLFSSCGIGYYVFHYYVIIEAVSLVTLRVFSPEYIDSLKVSGFYFVLLLPIHLINWILRNTVYPEASFFWTFGNPDNSILVMLKGLIPVNIIYLLPLGLVFIPYCLLVTFIVKKVRK